jgi:predicted transcriptional regulator of viral defense system
MEVTLVARPLTSVDLEVLALPAAFTARQAHAAGLTRTVRARLVEDGTLDCFARGLYRRAGAAPADLDLLEIALRSPRATICLASALVRHRLIDEIPPAIDVALPRGAWHPASPSVARWHTFDPGTFDIGRDLLPVDGSIAVGLYNAERSIIDAFHTRGINGTDLAIEALRRWLRLPGSQPAHLLAMADAWPRAQPPLRAALEAML